MKQRFHLFFVLFGVITSFFIGTSSKNFFASENAENPCQTSKYPYLNAALCDSPFVIDKKGYMALKIELEKLITSKTKAGKVTEVGIYFRDLHYGPTLGINEHLKFSPASLLKVPLMMAYLSMAESDSHLLDKKIAFRLTEEGQQARVRQDILPARVVKENQPYSINELLHYMIVYSDNEAQNGLAQYLKKISPDKDLMAQTLTDLGIVDPRNPLEESITVKSYGSIFTLLYHSAFFQTKEMSEKALELLVDADFDKGLVSGVPSGIKVANKFGERSSNMNNIKQLHDCGIVYYPNSPYMLCVMTRGYDTEELEAMIEDISEMVYEEFDSRKL